MQATWTDDDTSTTPGCLLLIDGCNAWIEGMKLSGRALGRNQNSAWRIDMYRLKRLVLSERDEARSVLFSSGQPEHADLWTILSRYVEVRLSKRSGYSGKEKQVDHKMVEALVADCTALVVNKQSVDAMAEQGAEVKLPDLMYRRASAARSRTYCLVTGDGDYVPSVRRALDAGFPVELYAWRRALAGPFLDLEQEYETFSIFYLDHWIDKIGFENRRFNTRTNVIPPEKTVVLFCEDLGFIDAFYEQAAALVEEVKEEFSTVQRDGQTVLLVFAYRLSEDLWSRLKERSTQALQVFDMVNFKQRQKAVHGSKVKPSGRFDPLQPDWQVVGRDDRKKKEARMQRRQTRNFKAGTKPCRHREFCRVGVKCHFVHTVEEIALFKVHGGKSPYRILKTVLCNKRGCVAGTENRARCTYLHQNEGCLCSRCMRIGCLQGAECDAIAESRPLISSEALANLRRANRIA